MLLLLSACFFVFHLPARVFLQPLFTDNMVLQQETLVPILGQAKANKKITIKTSWVSRIYRTIASDNGKWKVWVKTPHAGGPYEVAISDGQPVILKNVLIGEVWLCSGQSNMEFNVQDLLKKDYDREMNGLSGSQNIHILKVNITFKPEPQSAFSAANNGRTECNEESLKSFSALGYLFAKNINDSLHVPVGIIESCLDSTLAEDWVSADALKSMPDFNESLKSVKEQAEGKVRFEDQYHAWEERTIVLDPGFKEGKPIWAERQLDTSEWKNIFLPGTITDYGFKFFDGFAWVRKSFVIPENWTGKPVKLLMGGVDDYFNGTEIGRSDGVGISRKYVVPVSLVKAGTATLTVRIDDTGGDIAIYGYCGDIVLAQGNEKISLKGNWKARMALNRRNLPARPQNVNSDFNIPSVLFNGMIAPLVPYGIRGAIWYQSETSESKAWQYRDLLLLLIHDWRKQWNYEFPFYIAQLANYHKKFSEPSESDGAELREAQALTQHVANTGLACLVDIGEAGNIHPKNKMEAARRLSLVALTKTYGRNLVYSGPQYADYKIAGDSIVICFTHTEGGLKTPEGMDVKGFSVAGPDHVFHWVKARIQGNKVILSTPDVDLPIAARYGWADNPDCNLCNGAGLPAVPFRTDMFPGMTLGNKLLCLQRLTR
jgi:sialate O-acetylesterase